MKLLYYWDDNGAFSKSVFYQTDADVPNPVPANATTVAPVNGLYDPKWNGNEWVGITEADWMAQQPAPTPATPTTDQEAQAQLALQLAKTTQAQATFNAQVLLELADLKKPAATTDATTTTDTTVSTTTN